MKTKINIVIALGAVLALMSTLYGLGVGMSSTDSLENEEVARYEHRKQYSSLTTPAEKAYYAVGMSQMTMNKYLDGKDQKSLAIFYRIASQPLDTYYYWGMSTTFGFSKEVPWLSVPVNEDYYLAGFAQTVEKKILLPKLSGKEGQEYLMNFSTAPKTVENDSIEVEVVEVQ